MSNRLSTAFLIFLCFSSAFISSGALAQDAPGLWQQLVQAPFDSSRSASVENVILVRDRIRITLNSGTIQFTKPAQDVVFGAAFQGKGRVEVNPPNALEARQLRLFTGQETLSMDFSDATLTFVDATFDEIARQVHWKSDADKTLGELYVKRLGAREDVGAAVMPRLFKSILSGDRKRTALFFADLKTNDKGWVSFILDALSPEEVTVGRWANWDRTMQLDTWMSFPAGDRGAAEAYSDPLAREDFEIKKYRIDAKVTAAAELSAVTRVTVANRAGGERAFVFELDSNLRVDSVKDADGKVLGFLQPPDPKDRIQSSGDYIVVVLPSPSVSGTTQTFEFSYSGKRVIQKVGKGSYFCQSSGWYPTRPDNFSRRADFDMTFRCPKRSIVVATGNKTGESSDGDWTVTNWKSGIPLAVAGFAFGEFKVYTTKSGNVAIEAYANPEPDDQMREILNLAAAAKISIGSLTPAAMIKPMGDELANMVQVFEKYFGPYPYERLAITNIPYSYGQGWPTLIYLSTLSFLDSTQRNLLGLSANSTELTDFFRAHETSHQWWGHRVGWKSYHDQWLSEGFAQFSGNLYVQYRVNEKEYVTQLKKNKEELLSKDKKNRVYESVGPIWMGTRLASSDSPDDYSTVVYNKGGLVLNTIRRLFWNSQSSTPDDRFIALMKEYCQTYDNKPASTEDFKAILEKHMIPAMDLEGNHRMDWFFRQYVYGTGVPTYQLQWQAEDAGGGKWKVTGKVAQSGVPTGWLDSLPLYVQVAGKVSRIGQMAVKAPDNPFALILPYKPEKLILNYLEDTLAIIK